MLFRSIVSQAVSVRTRWNARRCACARIACGVVSAFGYPMRTTDLLEWSWASNFDYLVDGAADLGGMECPDLFRWLDGQLEVRGPRHTHRYHERLQGCAEPAAMASRKDVQGASRWSAISPRAALSARTARGERRGAGGVRGRWEVGGSAEDRARVREDRPGHRPDPAP